MCCCRCVVRLLTSTAQCITTGAVWQMIEFPLEYLVHYFMEHRADHLSASLACRHTLCIITHILFEHEATLDVHYAHFAGRALRFFDVRLLPYSCTLAWALARDPQTSAVLGGNGVVETLVDWLALCMLRFVDVAGVREPLADCLRSRTLLGSSVSADALFPSPNPPAAPLEEAPVEETKSPTASSENPAQDSGQGSGQADDAASVPKPLVNVEVEVVKLEQTFTVEPTLPRVAELPEGVVRQLSHKDVDVPDMIQHIVACLWLLVDNDANAFRVVERHALRLLVGIIHMAGEQYVQWVVRASLKPAHNHTSRYTGTERQLTWRSGCCGELCHTHISGSMLSGFRAWWLRLVESQRTAPCRQQLAFSRAIFCSSCVGRH